MNSGYQNDSCPASAGTVSELLSKHRLWQRGEYEEVPCRRGVRHCVQRCGETAPACNMGLESNPTLFQRFPVMGQEFADLSGVGSTKMEILISGTTQALIYLPMQISTAAYYGQQGIKFGSACTN